jgi:hypothetical protein
MDDPTAPPSEEAAPSAATRETTAENTNGVSGGEDRAASEQSGGDPGSAAIRPVFLGNLTPTYTHDDVVNIFHKPVVPPGMEEENFKPVAVDRLDQKRGYCFVFLRDAETLADKDNAEKFVSAINGM